MNRLYKSDVAKVRQGVAAVFVFVFCAVQLSGCGVVDKHLSAYDGAPSVDIDVSKIHDAVPRVEPLHPYGAKDYVVGGRRYHVLKSSKGYVKKGYASWYGTKFHGNHTSTQEKFSLYGMTAASKELPLPSYVQVTNLRNGKKIVVRVNDRGPFHSDRIIDLSYAAAKKLGFVNSGVAPVKVIAIDPKVWDKNSINEPVYAKNEPQSDKYEEAVFKSGNQNKNKVLLQVGAFAKLDNAKHLSGKVNKLVNVPVYIEHKANIYKVRVGPLANLTEGNKIMSLLERNGFNNVAIVGG